MIIHSGRLPELIKASITFKTLSEFLGLELCCRFSDFDTQALCFFFKVNAHQQFTNGFGPDASGEAVFAILILGLPDILLPSRADVL